MLKILTLKLCAEPVANGSCQGPLLAVSKLHICPSFIFYLRCTVRYSQSALSLALPIYWFWLFVSQERDESVSGLTGSIAAPRPHSDLPAAAEAYAAEAAATGADATASAAAGRPRGDPSRNRYGCGRVGTSNACQSPMHFHDRSAFKGNCSPSENTYFFKGEDFPCTKKDHFQVF